MNLKSNAKSSSTLLLHTLEFNFLECFFSNQQISASVREAANKVELEENIRADGRRNEIYAIYHGARDTFEASRSKFLVFEQKVLTWHWQGLRKLQKCKLFAYIIFFSLGIFYSTEIVLRQQHLRELKDKNRAKIIIADVHDHNLMKSIMCAAQELKVSWNCLKWKFDQTIFHASK
jgi:hypothetical protein